MNDENQKYGLPELKKYPMPDRPHVRSAIRFFNYVDPEHEEELARAILARMKEYGMTFDGFTVGEENRFHKYIPESELKHHGIVGMKWGVRRYQNPDGTLTELGKKHYKKLDDKWVKKNSEKIRAKAYKQSKREMKKVSRKLDRKYDVKIEKERQGRKYMNEYNKALADLMTSKVKDLSSPSGKVVKFVAKRGGYGVHMALADPGYDMDKVKNGVWENGRVAYKTNVLEKR